MTISPMAAHVMLRQLTGWGGGAAVSMVSCAACAGWMRRRAGPLSEVRFEAMGETAAASVLDFAIVMPFALILIGLVLQYGLMVHGLLVVNQAAYWAARAASTYIPAYYPEGAGDPNAVSSSHPVALFHTLDSFRLALNPLAGQRGADSGDEGPWVFGGTAGSYKYDRVRLAAAMGCLPVSTDIGFVLGVGSFFDLTLPGLDALDGLGVHKLAERLVYAWSYTDCEIHLWDGAGKDVSDPSQAVSIVSGVRFRLPLKVPFARRLLAQVSVGPWAWQPQLDASPMSSQPGQRYLPFFDTFYTELRASWVFFNENGYRYSRPQGTFPGLDSLDWGSYNARVSAAAADPRARDPSTVTQVNGRAQQAQQARSDSAGARGDQSGVAGDAGEQEAEANQRVAELQVQRQGLQDQIDGNNKVIASLQTDIAARQGVVQADTTQLAGATDPTQQASLQADINSQTTAISSDQTQQSQLSGANVKLQTQIATLDGQIQQAQAGRDEMHRISTELNGTAATNQQIDSSFGQASQPFTESGPAQDSCH